MARRTAEIGALVIAVLTLVAVGVVAAIRPAVTTAGTAALPTAPPIHAGTDPLLKPVAAQPNPVWRIDAHTLFGPQANPKYLMTVAADTKMAVVEAQSDDPNTNGAIIAVDPQSGTALWAAPSSFQTNGCAISRDGKIGCVQYTDRSQEHAVLGIIDPANGKLLSSKPINSAGYADIQRAADGFLVPTSAYSPDDSHKTVTLNWFSSDGARSWTHQGAQDLDNPKLSEAGDVVALSDYDKGAQVYQVDSGQLVYDGTADLAQASNVSDSNSATIEVDTEAGGFAVSIDDSTGQHDRVRIFDRLGIERQVLDGWKLPFDPAGTESDVIAVQRHDDQNYSAGAYTVSQGRLLWQTGGLGFDGGDHLQLVGSKYLAYYESGTGNGQPWTVLDAATGAKRGQIPASIYMDYAGFDGSRIYFTGDTTADQPGPGAVSAFDPEHGGPPLWQYKVTQSADEVNVRIVGPWLFRYDASVTGSVAALSRMG